VEALLLSGEAGYSSGTVKVGNAKVTVMTTESTISVDADLSSSRRSGEDRRSDFDRRRGSKGLFEMRARRDGLVSDRRQAARRGEDNGVKVRWYAFWRRTENR